MAYTKKGTDPVKENLIQFLLSLDVSKDQEAARDELVKQLERDDYVISDLAKRKGKKMTDVENEAVVYIKKVLEEFFAPKEQPSPGMKSKK
jgi:hypothetical protein